MTAVLLTYPLDIIRARLAFQVAGEIVYTGIANAFYMIVTREGGFFALYKGIVPTMVGMAPYAGKAAPPKREHSVVLYTFVSLGSNETCMALRALAASGLGRLWPWPLRAVAV